MIRVAYALQQQELIPILKAAYETEVIPLRDAPTRNYDVYFLEVTSTVQIERYRTVREKNQEALIALIGPADISLMQHAYCLEPIAYISDNTVFEKKVLEIKEVAKARFPVVKVKYGGRIATLRTNNIEYVESFRHYLEWHTINGVFRERKKLSAVVEEINTGVFIQIHKSFVINMRKIKQYNKNTIIMHSGIELPIGKVFQQKVLTLLEK